MDSWNHSKAVEIFERCLALDGEFAEALMGMGWSLLEIGRVNESCIALEKALGINPGLFQAWMNLGNTFKEMGNVSGAISSYRKAIELKPDFLSLFGLGDLLRERRVPESIIIYQALIEGKLCELCFTLGLILKEEERRRRQLKLSKSSAIDPDCINAYYSLVIYSVGMQGTRRRSQVIGRLLS